MFSWDMEFQRKLDELLFIGRSKKRMKKLNHYLYNGILFYIQGQKLKFTVFTWTNMFIYIYIYIYTHFLTFMNIYIYSHIQAYIYIYIYTCTHIYMHKHIYIYRYIHSYIHAFKYIFTPIQFICVCVCVCACACVCVCVCVREREGERERVFLVVKKNTSCKWIIRKKNKLIIKYIKCNNK